MEASQPQVQERELSYDEVLKEQGADAQTVASPRPRPGASDGVDQAPPPQAVAQQPAPSEEQEDIVDILAPKIGPRVWGFGKDNTSGKPVRTYVQYELSVITKTQWFSLVGEMFDKAIGGDNPITLNSLLTPPESARPGSGQQFKLEDFRDADLFVQALGKVMTYTPDFVEKSVCIWLSVPDYEWDLVRELIRQSPELGGLSDDDFEEMCAVFIDQNYVSIQRFFRERFGHLRDRWQARAKELEQSRSQKR